MRQLDCIRRFVRTQRLLAVLVTALFVGAQVAACPWHVLAEHSSLPGSPRPDHESHHESHHESEGHTALDHGWASPQTRTAASSAVLALPLETAWWLPELDETPALDRWSPDLTPSTPPPRSCAPRAPPLA